MNILNYFLRLATRMTERRQKRAFGELPRPSESPGSLTGYPVRVMPFPDEHAGEWHERFEERVGLKPTMMDYQAHGRYVSIALKRDSNEHDNTRMIREAKELCRQLFEPRDWGYTNDLHVWFTTEDQAILFKLSWSR